MITAIKRRKDYSVSYLTSKPNPSDGLLTKKVKKIIDKLPAGDITLSEIVNILGRDGMLLFAALLTIVFLIPVSIPGVSTAFGIMIFLIGLSLFLNRELWLPKFINLKTLSSDKIRSSLGKGLKWFRYIEKISKPNRLKKVINNKIAGKINSIAILLGALLLMLPFGLMPFSNTLPAIAILLLTLGMLQKDGIIVLLGYASVLGTFVYFGLFFSSIVVVIKQFIQ